MPQFKYTAYDYKTNKVSGELTAKDRSEANTIIKEKEMIPIEINELKGKDISKLNSAKSSALLSNKVSLKDVTLFSRQFATLVKADVPIVRCLFILSQNTQSVSFRKVLEKVKDDIENGDSLSTSLSKHPKVFPSIYIDMVTAAEMGGALPEVLDRLATYMENDKAIRSKVKSAFIYPAVVLTITLAVIIIMLTFVIPKFVPLFEGMGEELPFPTRFLLGTSTFFQSYWLLFILGIIGVVVGIASYAKTKKGRYQVDYIKLKIPALGTLFNKSAIARFARTLETLQKSGVPLIQSMEIVGKTSGNVIIEKAIAEATLALERGEGISIPLEDTKVFPLLVTQMLAIGEETGELEELLSKIADFYEEEVNMAVKNITSLLEPAITVILGIIVGFIALAIIMPMYNMMGAMQNDM